MKKSFLILLQLLLVQAAFGQVKYIGSIGDQPIELYTDIYSDSVGTAVYVFTQNDDPFPLQANLQPEALYLYRVNNRKDTTETFRIPRYEESSTKLSGSWKSVSSDSIDPVRLTKVFEIGSGNDKEWDKREILQQESLPDYYFKTIKTKKKGSYYSYVSGVKILEKNTDRLVQEISDLRFADRSIHSISADDYNFDGITDFSIFKSFHAGPNTTSKYYLFNPETNRFFDSGFEGVSLEFSQDEKRIYERNSWQAGYSIYSAIYKVVDNKMFVVEEHCLLWDPDKEERTERPIEECY